MKTIYLDSDFKCHVTDDGTGKAVETDCFEGKCDAVIEGYRLVPAGECWVRRDGVRFSGEMITPWMDTRQLEALGRRFAQEQLSDMETALQVLGVTVDD